MEQRLNGPRARFGSMVRDAAIMVGCGFTQGRHRMFNHLMLGSNDIDRSKTFYDALMASMGGPAATIDAKGRLIYAHRGGRLMISQPIDGAPACGANGGTVGFKMESEAEGHAWHQAGVAHGGSAVEDAPGIRPSGAWLAYLRDPDGNKLCALYRPA